jgi:hypothetical protein
MVLDPEDAHEEAVGEEQGAAPECHRDLLHSGIRHTGDLDCKRDGAERHHAVYAELVAVAQGGEKICRD